MRLIIQRSGVFPKTEGRFAQSDYPLIFIIKDNWNDYSYMTMCSLFILQSPDDSPIQLGNCRIMIKGQDKYRWTFDQAPDTFPALPPQYCSLGVELKYYNQIRAVLGVEQGSKLMASLRDIAWNKHRWQHFDGDTCFDVSLQREKNMAILIRDSIANIFGKSATRKKRDFTYSVILPGASYEISIPFDFRRKSFLPNRTCLLVGQNGVGKTQILSKLAVALTGVVSDYESNDDFIKILESAGKVSPTPSFYRVIAVSFNAFDNFEIIPDTEDADVRYSYCGIRKRDNSILAAHEQIAEIKQTIAKMDNAKFEFLSRSLQKTLRIKISNKEDLDENFYNRLSAGQRIVTNIITHVISKIEKQSLVLIDEPETHLHPQLATSLITSIGDLLKEYQSFSIIATHSPLIAQQIPSSSIRVITRQNDTVEAFLPDIECFGENLSEITSALYETNEFFRDYKTVIDKEVKRSLSNPDKVLELLKTNLGANAKSYLLAKTMENSN